jgi:CHAT domain-containing protein
VAVAAGLEPRRSALPIDPAPLTQIQDSSKSDETLLEYVLDEPNSSCISITRTTANLRVLPVGRKEIEKLVQRYIDEIRAKRTGVEEAKQLHAFLVQPIPETSTGKRFIVVPDGILNLLPFETLRNSEGQYLLTSDVISYAPSATVLDACGW